MTVIRFDPQTDAADGTTRPLAGVLTAFATAVRADGETVVFPGMAEWRFTATDRPTVALDPPGANWAYVLQFQPEYGDRLERAVQFTGTEVAWDALTDVDPGTFVPIIPTPPSAADLLAQSIQILTQVQGYASLSVGGVLQGSLPNPGLNDSAVDLFVGAKVATNGTHTQLAVAAAVTAGIAAWVGAAPDLLNTLAEIDAQLASDESTVAALTTLLSQKAPLASPALSGVPTAPTAAPGTNTTQLATAAFVKAALDSLAASVAATYSPLLPAGVPTTARPVYADTTAAGTTLYDVNGTVL